ncbi:MAG: TMEM165/GDT1 family protein [Nitrospirota bacterium]
MTAFWGSLALVFLAEMGDKTQLLALAFSTRYRWQTVLWGVFVATAANHLAAVYVGKYLTVFIPFAFIKIAASIAFILFGIWTLRGDSLENEDQRFHFNPFWTVALAFFLAEMGDKTQLATMVLAADFNAILPVWLGTTIGMVLADAAGIIGGVVLHKKIPEKQIKWIAALIFIAFGLWGLYDALVSLPPSK